MFEDQLLIPFVSAMNPLLQINGPDTAVPVYVHVVRDIHVHIQFCLEIIQINFVIYHSTLRYNCGNSKFKNLSF